MLSQYSVHDCDNTKTDCESEGSTEDPTQGLGEGSAEGSAEGSYYNYEGSAEGSTEGSAEDYYTYREVNVNYYDQSQELGQVKSSLHYFTIANFTRPLHWFSSVTNTTLYPKMLY